MTRTRLAFVSLLLFSTLAGCSGLGRARIPESARLFEGENVKSTDITEGSREHLLRENLLTVYEQDPEAAFKELLGRVLADPEKQEDPRSLFCCAELANAVAERKTSRWNRRPVIHPRTETGKWAVRGRDRFDSYLADNEEILTYYKMASYLSYSYLVFAHQKLGTELYNPRFRRACDLYNHSLSQTIRYGLKRTPHDPESASRLDDFSRGSQIKVELVGFDWNRSDVDDLLMAEDHVPEEVSLKTRRHGLGVPMIGIRYGDAAAHGDVYPPVACFPVTALYIPSESYDLEETEVQERIVLVNPWNQETIRVGGSVLPVEADLTTPLNYMLKEAGFADAIWEGFLGGETHFEGEVNLLRPHQPGRTPIVLLHGLLGSPVSWEVFMNGLMDDPWIRRNYEFWFARYPTGKSFLHNARALRESLVQLRTELDPSGSDPALDRMVLVGHSMGGILAKLLTHDSGDHFWNMVWEAPPDQLDLTPAEREEMMSLFYFQSLPCVEKVVYLATPHRGSPLAGRPVGRLGGRLIDLPDQARQSLRDIGDRNSQYAKIRLTEQSFNSTHDLRPDSPPILALQNLDRPAGIEFYNFIGDPSGGRGEGSDGVVPVSSASVEGVALEKTVPAKHREIHSHPDVIREVVQILKDRRHQSDQPAAPAASSADTISEIEAESSIQ